MPSNKKFAGLQRNHIKLKEKEKKRKKDPQGKIDSAVSDREFL